MDFDIFEELEQQLSEDDLLVDDSLDGSDVAHDLEEPWLEEARRSFDGLTDLSFKLPVV